MPTDYLPPLQRAVQGLPVDAADKRRELYDRARTALLRQLRGREPPTDEAQITKERMLLEDAIRRLEASYGTEDRSEPDQQGRTDAVEREAGAPLQRPSRRPPAGGAATTRGATTRRGGPSRVPPPAVTQRTGERPALGRVALGVAGLAVIGIVGTAAWLGLQPSATQTALHPVATGQTAAPQDTAAAGQDGQAPATPAPDAPGGKFADRLTPGRDGATSDDAAGPAATGSTAVASAPAAQTSTAEAPPSQVAQTQTQAPAQTLSPAPQTSLDSGAAVAQEATLQDIDGQPARYDGHVTWHTESVSGGQGAPLDLAIKGEVEIPDRKMKVLLTIRRNTDAALPASHTLQIQFTVPGDFPNGGIGNVPGILMKAAEAQRGAQLSGLSVKVTNGYFLIGFQDPPTDTGRNEALLKERDWFDIPILYGNNRRAILTLDKGIPGEHAFADAFAAWGGSAPAASGGG